MNNKLLARYAIRSFVQWLGMAVCLFWPAGRLGWWPAWAALAVMAGWLVATGLILRADPALLAERMAPYQRGRTWDVVIVQSFGLIQAIRYVVAGLDVRYGWSSGIPLAAQVAALALCIAGYLVFAWATATNTFFASFFRMQSDRGHSVVSAGPYRFVRHPAYAGAILYELAVSILLGSWWALLVSLLTVALFILRTALEDRSLQTELPGYTEYTRRVRFRLVPGVW